MASGTGRNVLQGAGWLYVGAYQAAEPADSAINTTPQASAWADMGFTDGGLTFEGAMEYSAMHVDQVADRVGTKMVTREVSLATNLAEATLENLLYAFNTGTVATGSGFKYYEPTIDGTELQPTYRAFLFDGYAPASAAGVIKRRRFIIRKGIQSDNVGVPYKKDGLTIYPVKFVSHFIDSSTKPFRIIDET